MNRLMDWITESLEADASQSKWRRFLAIVVAAVLLAMGLRSKLVDQVALSDGIILAGASMLVGLLVGFLFGIPRTTKNEREPSSGTSRLEDQYHPNTNLEEISDWLTKIIIGVGLVELREIPDLIESIGKSWEGNLGSTQFASGLVVYSVVTGFLIGYLWTRLGLVGDFIDRDPRRIVSRLLRRVATATQQDPMLTSRAPNRQVFSIEQAAAAEALQTAARQSRVTLDELREQVHDLAAVYESLRASMPGGSERTRKMEVVASQMRALSLAAYPLLGELVKSESPGDRLAAVTFLQSRPNAEFYWWLSARLHEEKPFIGYHAAVALLHAARSSESQNTPALEGAIAEAIAQTKSLADTTDRRSTLLAAQETLRKSQDGEE